jgi:site-specific DNA-methyltransferase (adenine-specific)
VQSGHVLHGDPKELLALHEAETIDALLTAEDPELQEDVTDIFREAFRVLKPGAHGLIWSLPTSSIFTGLALISAGFEVRDSLLHLTGAGHESWWLVRKPIAELTIVKQVRKTGTGAINIEACRVGTSKASIGRFGLCTKRTTYGGFSGNRDPNSSGLNPNIGRWPANVVLSHAAECGNDACAPGCAVSELDGQSGLVGGGGGIRYNSARENIAKGREYDRIGYGHDDEGGASRFFYTAEKTKLMRYFTRLITPPGGTVLDPFAGSGTTGVAAIQEGFTFLGIEQDLERHRLATSRVASALQEASPGEPISPPPL